MSLNGYNPYTYAAGFRNQEFHHAVLSVSGTIHMLYLDGVQVAQNSSAGNVFASYSTITNTIIGAQTTLSQAFQGTIGDVRVYNYAIQQPLVTSLYRDRNLVVYYPFDNSVNSLTPNYATLVYDASLIGQATVTTTGANVGSGALSLTNSATTAATNYVLGKPGIYTGSGGQVASWNLNAANGLTFSCWINVAGVAGQIQRIFDIPLSVGTKGLAIDISGTNMIYSGWVLPLASPIRYYSFDSAGTLSTNLIELITNTNTADTSTGSNTNVLLNGAVINTNASYILPGRTGSLSVPNSTNGSNNMNNTCAATLLQFNIGNSTGMTICYWYYLTKNTSFTNAGNMFQLAPNVTGYGDAYNIKTQNNGGASTGMNFQIYYNNDPHINIDLGSTATGLSSWKFLAFSISSVTGVNIYYYDLNTQSFSKLATDLTLSTSQWANYQNKLIRMNLGSGFFSPYTGYYNSCRIYDFALSANDVQRVISLR